MDSRGLLANQFKGLFVLRFNHVRMSLCMHVHECSCLWSAEKGVRSPEGSCELPNMGTRALCGVVTLSPLSSPMASLAKTVSSKQRFCPNGILSLSSWRRD